MGLLTDMHSGERGTLDPGGYAVVFWICVGVLAGGGFGVYLLGYAEKVVLIFMLLGALIGIVIGFYAGFGKTRLAWALALPALPLAVLGWFIGIG
jgi:hypothetical protein